MMLVIGSLDRLVRLEIFYSMVTCVILHAWQGLFSNFISNNSKIRTMYFLFSGHIYLLFLLRSLYIYLFVFNLRKTAQVYVLEIMRKKSGTKTKKIWISHGLKKLIKPKRYSPPFTLSLSKRTSLYSFWGLKSSFDQKKKLSVISEVEFNFDLF